MEPDKIVIDGSIYEGGGQIIRSCLALSIILKKPFFIHSIRKNRPNPGINNQLRAILGPFMPGVKVPANGSSYMHYEPAVPNIEKISSHTSSSCTLMLQSLIPIAAMLGFTKNMVVEGGTDVSKSPPLESFTTCLIPLMAKMGVEVRLEKVKKGYYPKGGGSITYNVSCKKLVPIEMVKFEAPTNIIITYYAKKNNLPETHVELKKGIKKMMRYAFGYQLDLDIEIKIELTPGTKGDNYGIGCILRNENVIWDCSVVGEPATEYQILERLKHEIASKACLDDFHQDQLIIYMALADGVSKLRIGSHKSDHTKSMLEVLDKFIPEAKIHFEDGILEIQGINYLGRK